MEIFKSGNTSLILTYEHITHIVYKLNVFVCSFYKSSDLIFDFQIDELPYGTFFNFYFTFLLFFSSNA